jgi:hypothetical protein
MCVHDLCRSEIHEPPSRLRLSLILIVVNLSIQGRTAYHRRHSAQGTGASRRSRPAHTSTTRRRARHNDAIASILVACSARVDIRRLSPGSVFGKLLRRVDCLLIVTLVEQRFLAHIVRSFAPALVATRMLTEINDSQDAASRPGSSLRFGDRLRDTFNIRKVIAKPIMQRLFR